jgi:hypothetical protein
MNINQFDPDNSHGTTLGEIPLEKHLEGRLGEPEPAPDAP